MGKNKPIQTQTIPTQQTSQTWADQLFQVTKEQKTKAAEDLDVLKKIYAANKSDDVLKQIIAKEAQNYQFTDAIENIKLLKNPEEIDPQLYIYIAINSSILKIWESGSIDNMMQIIDTYKNKNLIDNDDVTFYQGLKEIWNNNYNQALSDRSNIQKADYKTTIDGFKEAITSHQTLKSLPSEYRDGLVALAALKNGYFNIARKVAITAINKNDKYILPYQILAYSHFLSNNWETAIEYFFKLADFDPSNKDMYNFLIWASYYRKWDYSSSALYLSQVTKTNPSDTLRYLIQDYIQLNANDKLNESRTILAKQNDISPSDFSLYFYTVLYRSYFTNNAAEVDSYKDLSQTFIQNCDDVFSGNDVCLYGKLGKAAIENTIKNNEAEYISLVKRYNVSYLYHIFGDYFLKEKQLENAKQAYGKAIALSQDKNEQDILKEKLDQLAQ